MFVQPVRELLGPSDLSLTLSLDIFSPFTQAITFMHVVHVVRNIIEKGSRSILNRSNINLKGTQQNQ